jgi:hypothetical protein
MHIPVRQQQNPCKQDIYNSQTGHKNPAASSLGSLPSRSAIQHPVEQRLQSTSASPLSSVPRPLSEITRKGEFQFEWWRNKGSFQGSLEEGGLRCA